MPLLNLFTWQLNMPAFREERGRMVLVKCLQMSNGQGCRMTLVPNYPFHWRLRYFVSDSIAPLNMGMATTASCQKHA